MTPELWLQLGIALLAGLGSCGAVYVAIRVDLARAIAKAEAAANAAERAHDRIDRLMTERHR